jgi:AmmeMemoRadiSam system protein B
MQAVLAQNERLRSPMVAGMFYPEEKAEILKIFNTYGLGRGKGGCSKAIIAPHGAWRFSGTVAAEAFSHAAGRSFDIKRVVILGPIHDKRESGIFLSNSHNFITPLGKLPVDEELSMEFEYYGSHFEINDIPHLAEHSIEILLPFIKFLFPHAMIAPVLMGQPNAEYINDLARTLKKVLEPVMDETLIVVSCNLFIKENTGDALQNAEDCLNLFSFKNGAGLAAAILDNKVSSCGGALAAGLLCSGLIDRKCTCYVSDKLVSAVGMKNKTVFYGAISFE